MTDKTRPNLYILKDQTPIPVKDALEWGRWYENAERKVKRNEIAPGIDVSTVFLGIDHGCGWYERKPGYKPQLFETMVFGGPMDMHQQRYSTWAGAEYGHDKIVEQVKVALAHDKQGI